MAETVAEPKNVKVKFGGKGLKPKRLPVGAKKAAKRGLISPKQMARLRGEA